VAADVAGFLREREALIASATPGPEAASALSDLTDRAVSALAEAALSRLRSPWALLALGGWGARRLLPHSDLDLLVLTDAPASELRPALTEVLYPLWDSGLHVGHQVRSRRDHERMVRTDLETLTATLTGRVLGGDAGLAERLLTDVAADARRRAKRHVPALVGRPRAGSPYLLEPDLKEGAGGQRDLDEIVWLGAVLTGRPSVGPEALADTGTIDAAEAARLREAGARITAARWALHRLVTRPTSLLSLELAAEADLDLSTLHAAMADAHHMLLRIRGRLTSRPTTFDPRCPAGPHAPLDGAALFAILDRGPGALDDLEEATWAGLLDDLVPAFGELLDVRRPALSHLYTVGAHCLRAATAVSSSPAERPEAARALASVSDRRPLQTAALLHDVGKSHRGPGHEERGAEAVRTLGARFGLHTTQVEEAALLVHEHLLLAQTASGRDIHDEDVLLRTAARLGRPSVVDELYLLTMADSLATGPSAWTAWHAALVGELSDRLKGALSDSVQGAGLVEHAEETRDRALQAIGELPAAAQLAAFVRRAPLRYLAATAAGDVVRHAQLVTAMADSGLRDGFQVAIGTGPTASSWRVSVAAFDRPALFATICGALSLTGLDIMAADAYDAQGGVALDVFIVRSDTRATIDTATWAAFERHLRSAFLDPAGLAVRLAERRSHYPAKARTRTRVEVEETGAYATAVKVRAADRVGLLYDLALAFAQTGLQIRWARAITQDGIARDVFHVTDETGEPVDDAGVIGHLAMRIRERV
jgi:UTP:GlnB (protein PII) uridylyltransferase